jgi:hypothetical protein
MKKDDTPKRSLDDIAAKIHRAERASIFEIGALLLEAHERCEHGKWREWLYDEFEWSEDTAANYIKAAKLAAKFRNFRNLKLTKSTIYALADEDESDLPAIITELEKHALKRHLKAEEAEDIIAIGRARGRHGDHPDATLRALDELDGEWGLPWEAQAIERLKSENPTTDEAAETIVKAIAAAEDPSTPSTGHEDGGHEGDDHHDDHHDEDHDKDEAKDLLDGPPPLPPPSPQPTPSPREEGELAAFKSAIEKLKQLMTKPAAKFKGAVAANDVTQIANFLISIAEASEDAGSATIRDGAANGAPMPTAP